MLIPYNVNNPDDYEIFVMNADGSDQKQLTHNRALDEHPTWSPDGSRLVFQSDDSTSVEPAGCDGSVGVAGRRCIHQAGLAAPALDRATATHAASVQPA